MTDRTSTDSAVGMEDRNAGRNAPKNQPLMGREAHTAGDVVIDLGDFGPTYELSYRDDLGSWLGAFDAPPVTRRAYRPSRRPEPVARHVVARARKAIRKAKLAKIARRKNRTGKRAALQRATGAE